MKILRIIFIQIVIVFVLLFVAELFLSAFIPVGIRDASVNNHMTQTLRGVKSEIIYSRNTHGFRTSSMTTKQKPEQAIRIFCLGASTTDQATQSYEDTWCALLEKQAKRAFPSMKIEVAGFGRGGWKAADLLYWTKENLLQFKPDIVFVLMGINDLVWNGGPQYSYEGIEKRLSQKQSTNNFLDSCSESLQLCKRFQIAKEKIVQQVNLITSRSVVWHSRKLPERQQAYREKPFVTDVHRHPDPIHEFEDAMRTLLNFLVENEIQPIVLGQPVLWKNNLSQEEKNVLWFSVATQKGSVRPSGQWLLEEMQRYNRLQEKLGNQYGAPFVDLDAEIPKTLNVYFDDCHFTDQGSRHVAETVFPLLKRLLKEGAID